MIPNEAVRAKESASVAVAEDAHEDVRWAVDVTVEKREGDWTGEQIAAGEAPEPYEVLRRKGNLLTTLGATALWTLLIGGGGTTFANANAHLGVGDSTTAAAVGQTDLQAATNKLRKAMEATYPQVSGATITFRSSFGTSEANFAWEEWATFNAAAAGTMLNRKVENLGTKASGTWTLTITITLA